jgi:hypothetical protein
MNADPNTLPLLAHNAAAARPWSIALALSLLCGVSGLQAAVFSVTTPIPSTCSTLDAQDLKDRPLRERRALLEKLMGLTSAGSRLGSE